jgi:hypothetical protein
MWRLTIDKKPDGLYVKETPPLLAAFQPVTLDMEKKSRSVRDSTTDPYGPPTYRKSQMQ